MTRIKHARFASSEVASRFAAAYYAANPRMPEPVLSEKLGRSGKVCHVVTVMVRA